MADRDRAAVDVEAVVRDAERVAAVDRLHREGFVEFPQPDVVDREVVTREQFGDREDGADAHLARLAADDHHPAIEAERRDVARRGERRVHDDDRSGAVGELR